jgi:hypothetical protein
MKQRCYNVNADNYGFYGGRGIWVCPEWMNSYARFLADMGDPPFPEYQLDRINNEDGYYKDNCRWVSPKENSSNTRRNRKFLYEGEELTISEIARRSGIHVETLRSRLRVGYTIDEALAKVKHSK